MADYHGFHGDVTQKSDVDVFVPELWSDGIYRYSSYPYTSRGRK